MRFWATLIVLLFQPHANASEPFPTCDPVSEFLADPTALVITDRAISSSSAPDRYLEASLESVDPSSHYFDFLYPAPSLAFCAEWNPEFAFNGHRCCTIKASYKARSRRNLGKALAAGRCAWQRRKTSYCDERTALQIDYAERVASGRIEDPLAFLAARMDRRGPQAYCTVNNGFLAFGRALIATERNRLLIRNEHRCLNYGTDRMIGMLEWLGRKIGRHYPAQDQVRLIIGDISAPKGGCLAGRPGRKGHASHTSGQDVDFAFFNPKRPTTSLVTFQREFDAQANWWLIKQLFRNPFACVKIAFLDRTLIRKLEKVARGDPEWTHLNRYIRHSRGHANHWHVRIGTIAGSPGCASVFDPGELELDEFEDLEEFEGEPLDQSAPDLAITPASQSVELEN